MNGRFSVGLLTFAVTLGCAGCITTQDQKSVVSNTTVDAPSKGPDPKPGEVPIVEKKSDEQKRSSAMKIELAYGKMKEAEADSEAGKRNPEIQSRLRDEARKAYQNALKNEPNNLDAQRCLAGLFTKTSEFDRALEIYKKAMAKNPKDASLWYDLGNCHHRRKDFQESLRCFSKALEIEPDNRACMMKVGLTLAWMGQLDQGLAYLKRAQGAAQAHYIIARVLLQRDQNQLARQHLAVALRENNQLAEARELLAALDGPSARN
jgi:tetratricopeptide (TPR) repeat protein